MKPELINLLHRLKAHPDLEQFQNLIIFPNGNAAAVFRNGCHSFADLDDLEKFSYQPDPPSQPGTPTGFHPSAQGCEETGPVRLGPTLGQSPGAASQQNAVPRHAAPPPLLSQILALVAERTEVSIDDLQHRARGPAHVSNARLLFYWLAARFHHGRAAIARAAQRKDHHTVALGIASCQDLIDTDPQFAALARQLLASLSIAHRPSPITNP